jgi:arylformamidase
MKLLDLSYVIENGMPTCGTPWHERVNIKHLGLLEEVGRNTHALTFGSHTGTHMDAPYHFIETGHTIETTPLETLCGEISVIDFTRFNGGSVVKLEDVKQLKVTERMLFRFDWFKTWKTPEFYKSFPYFDEEAVDYLIKGGIKLMAMDTPSPDYGGNIQSKEDSPNHKALLKKDVVIVEYLTNTDQIDLSKEHRIIALPLKFKGCDGSPSRVILEEY